MTYLNVFVSWLISELNIKYIFQNWKDYCPEIKMLTSDIWIKYIIAYFGICMNWRIMKSNCYLNQYNLNNVNNKMLNFYLITRYILLPIRKIDAFIYFLPYHIAASVWMWASWFVTYTDSLFWHLGKERGQGTFKLRKISYFYYIRGYICPTSKIKLMHACCIRYMWHRLEKRKKMCIINYFIIKS